MSENNTDGVKNTVKTTKDFIVKYAVIIFKRLPYAYLAVYIYMAVVRIGHQVSASNAFPYDMSLLAEVLLLLPLFFFKVSWRKKGEKWY